MGVASTCVHVSTLQGRGEPRDIIMKTRIQLNTHLERCPVRRRNKHRPDLIKSIYMSNRWAAQVRCRRAWIGGVHIGIHECIYCKGDGMRADLIKNMEDESQEEGEWGRKVGIHTLRTICSCVVNESIHSARTHCTVAGT